MIFVDTGAWFARYVADDVDHATAVQWFRSTPDRIVTTDYVLDELLTLLKVRGYAAIAFSIGDKFLAGKACQLEYVQAADINRAWNIFSQFRDKGWSFTDCTSLAIMERLQVSVACAFDSHFRQFGNIVIVP